MENMEPELKEYTRKERERAATTKEREELSHGKIPVQESSCTRDEHRSAGGSCASRKKEKRKIWFFWYKMKNVKFTAPIQQLYNNPSHEGGSHILGPTLM
jgi:hypothetical protein